MGKGKKDVCVDGHKLYYLLHKHHCPPVKIQMHPKNFSILILMVACWSFANAANNNPFDLQGQACSGPNKGANCCQNCPASHPYCTIDCRWRNQCAAGCSSCLCTCKGESCCYGGNNIIPCPGGPSPGPSSGAWVAGGDEGNNWTASASSQYGGCAGYDLCRYSHICDGTSSGNGGSGTVGKIFALQGPNSHPFPQWVQIDFGHPLTFTKWRVWSGSGPPLRLYSSPRRRLQFAGKDMSLAIGPDWNVVPGSNIANSDSVQDHTNGVKSGSFQPVTAQVVRVYIQDEWKDSDPENGFQLYIDEVQFFASGSSPSTYACLDNQCVVRAGGISHQTCEAICG